MVDKLNDDIGEEKRLQLWEMMLKLRLVEKKAYDLFLQNLIKGTSHLALGQEAIAVLMTNGMLICPSDIYLVLAI